MDAKSASARFPRTPSPQLPSSSSSHRTDRHLEPSPPPSRPFFRRPTPSPSPPLTAARPPSHPRPPPGPSPPLSSQPYVTQPHRAAQRPSGGPSPPPPPPPQFTAPYFASYSQSTVSLSDANIPPPPPPPAHCPPRACTAVPPAPPPAHTSHVNASSRSPVNSFPLVGSSSFLTRTLLSNNAPSNSTIPHSNASLVSD